MPLSLPASLHPPASRASARVLTAPFAALVLATGAALGAASCTRSAEADAPAGGTPPEAPSNVYPDGSMPEAAAVAYSPVGRAAAPPATLASTEAQEPQPQQEPPPATEPPAQEAPPVVEDKPRIDDRIVPLTPAEQEAARRETAITEGPIIVLPPEEDEPLDLEPRLDRPASEEALPPGPLGDGADEAAHEGRGRFRREERQRGLLFFAGDESGEVDVLAFGVQWAPEYPGASDRDVLPYVWVNHRFDDFTLQSRARGLGLRAAFPIDELLFAGPVIGIAPSRRHEDVEDPRVRQLAEVDRAVEFGFFIEGGVPGPFTATDAVTAELEILTTLDAGYHGGTSRMELAYESLYRGELFLRTSVGAQYSTGPYHDDFFSVSTQESAATGLSSYEADGGFTALGFGLDAAWLPADAWGLTARVRYDFLTGEAKNNPIVSQANEGDNRQIFLGVGLDFRL